MSTAQLDELASRRAMIVPFSVDQYHRMIDAGILEEGAPIELLDGYLVRKDRSAAGADPMTVGPSHSWVIGQLAALCTNLAPHDCHSRIQQPLTFQPDNEPEPDVAIVRGSAAEYRNRHPSASEVLCLFEVADSSLHRDRTTKLRVYAENGIPMYVIIDLTHGLVEAYREPVSASSRYARAETFRRENRIIIPLPDGKTLELPADQILP